MADTTYRIVHCKDNTIQVEIVRMGVLPQTAAGFETEAAASSWIAQDQRLWNAADPFQTQALRRWRGV
jgi:hypothetical protein